MTPSDPEALRVAFLVVGVLDRLGVAYHLSGSYASGIHGVLRQTHDVDLVVDFRADRIEELANSLERDFFVDGLSIARAVSERSSFNIVHMASGVKVDLFLKGDSRFDLSEFERKVTVSVGHETPRQVHVKSAEDTVLRKLLWFRMGGEVSDRQWADVRGIVAVQDDRLDSKYLKRWADDLGIRDLTS